MIGGLTQCGCPLKCCTKHKRCVLHDDVVDGDFYPELKLFTGGAMEEKRPAVYGDCIIHCESRVDEDG